MARNIEIKARIPDLAPIRARAMLLASGPMQVIEQTDTFFVVPRGRLKVRAFADGSGELISYERANESGPKESTYTRVKCEDAGTLCQPLGRALGVRGVVVKQRELFLIGRTRVHLDRVEGLGCFVELEVVLGPEDSLEKGHHEALELLRLLEIPERTLVAEAYIDLVEQPHAQAHL